MATFGNPPPPPPPLPTWPTGVLSPEAQSHSSIIRSDQPSAQGASVHRVETSSTTFEPTWYFFYGTLKSSALLKTLLPLPEDAPLDLIPATLVDSEYRLAKWGSYLTLIPEKMQRAGERQRLEGERDAANLQISPLHFDDGEEYSQTEKPIKGSALLIECAAHEKKLQIYETSAYQPVDCRILFQSTDGRDSQTIINGKVFVYADELGLMRKEESDIDRWEKQMGMTWPVKRRPQPGK